MANTYVGRYNPRKVHRGGGYKRPEVMDSSASPQLSSILDVEEIMKRDRSCAEYEKAIFCADRDAALVGLDRLWKFCYYEPISQLRQIHGSGAICHLFIYSGLGYFQQLVTRISSYANISMLEPSRGHGGTRLTKEALKHQNILHPWIPMLLVKCYLCLGDLTRYLYELEKQSDYLSSSHSHYMNAFFLDTENGFPLSQLGNLYKDTGDMLSQFFFYMRGHTAARSFAMSSNRMKEIARTIAELHMKVTGGEMELVGDLPLLSLEFLLLVCNLLGLRESSQDDFEQGIIRTRDLFTRFLEMTSLSTKGVLYETELLKLFGTLAMCISSRRSFASASFPALLAFSSKLIGGFLSHVLATISACSHKLAAHLQVTSPSPPPEEVPKVTGRGSADNRPPHEGIQSSTAAPRHQSTASRRRVQRYSSVELLSEGEGDPESETENSEYGSQESECENGAETGDFMWYNEPVDDSDRSPDEEKPYENRNGRNGHSENANKQEPTLHAGPPEATRDRDSVAWSDLAELSRKCHLPTLKFLCDWLNSSREIQDFGMVVWGSLSKILALLPLENILRSAVMEAAEMYKVSAMLGSMLTNSNPGERFALLEDHVLYCLPPLCSLHQGLSLNWASGLPSNSILEVGMRLLVLKKFEPRISLLVSVNGRASPDAVARSGGGRDPGLRRDGTDPPHVSSHGKSWHRKVPLQNASVRSTSVIANPPRFQNNSEEGWGEKRQTRQAVWGTNVIVLGLDLFLQQLPKVKDLYYQCSYKCVVPTEVLDELDSIKKESPEARSSIMFLDKALKHASRKLVLCSGTLPEYCYDRMSSGYNHRFLSAAVFCAVEVSNQRKSEGRRVALLTVLDPRPSWTRLPVAVKEDLQSALDRGLGLYTIDEFHFHALACAD